MSSLSKKEAQKEEQGDSRLPKPSPSTAVVWFVVITWGGVIFFAVWARAMLELAQWGWELIPW